MGPYIDHEQLAAHALQLCEDVRVQSQEHMYEGLVRECARFPGRMAQLMMALAVWVDYEGPISALMARADAIADARMRDEDGGGVLAWEA